MGWWEDTKNKWNEYFHPQSAKKADEKLQAQSDQKTTTTDTPAAQTKTQEGSGIDPATIQSAYLTELRSEIAQGKYEIAIDLVKTLTGRDVSIKPEGIKKLFEKASLHNTPAIPRLTLRGTDEINKQLTEAANGTPDQPLKFDDAALEQIANIAILTDDELIKLLGTLAAQNTTPNTDAKAILASKAQSYFKEKMPQDMTKEKALAQIQEKTLETKKLDEEKRKKQEEEEKKEFQFSDLWEHPEKIGKMFTNFETGLNGFMDMLGKMAGKFTGSFSFMNGIVELAQSCLSMFSNDVLPSLKDGMSAMASSTPAAEPENKAPLQTANANNTANKEEKQGLDGWKNNKLTEEQTRVATANVDKGKTPAITPTETLTSKPA